MKKSILFMAIFTFASYNASAQQPASLCGDYVFNGKVGIGTTTPSSELQVLGVSRFQSIMTNFIALDRYNHDFTYDGKTFNYYSLRWGADSWHENPGTLWLSGTGMKFFTGGTPRLSITPAGNVGIGRTDPYYKLDVEGTIRVRAIKINLNSGADFVFDDNYQLKSIGEVQKFIKENKHLPEIPSATEMMNNDVDLGDMQIKLLQKIEELTLYVIQQQETIEE